MATYNGAPFLTEQLESIANQTFSPVELIICDDASTDDTAVIARAFAQRSGFPVRVHINGKRLGYTRNFRKAASLCTGELIAFCDQDDRWIPERLEACAPLFDDPKLQLLYHNAWLVDRECRRFGLLYDAEREGSALNLRPMGPWNHSFGLVQIFRSRLRQYDELWDKSINHIADPIGILAHDQWYFFLAEAIGKVHFLDQPLVEYRQHETNLFGAATMRPAVENRLLKRLAHDGSQDIRLVNAALARCSILRELAFQLPKDSSRLLLIADKYEVLADRLYRRFNAYSADRFLARMFALVQSWRKGDYSEWPWGFHRWSVLRDLWSGVICSKTSETMQGTK